MYQQRYLITGGSGFIGTALITQLLLENNEVTVLTRNQVKTANHFAQVMQKTLSEAKNPKQKHTKIQTISSIDDLNHDDTFEVIINLAGQGIAEKRWSDLVKQQLLDSRFKTTQALFEYVENAVVKPDVFISGSALGFYGLREDDAEIDETGKGDNSFSSQLCQQWEQKAQQVEALGIRTCYLRTGIVLGKDGGALAKMLPPFKMGLGGPIGSGKQWMSWIHLDDIVGIICHAVENDFISGAINGTAPSPVTNKVFVKTLGKVLCRPAFIPMPAFMVKLLFGQMGEELLLSGQRVIPKKIKSAGYSFEYPELQVAIRNCLR